MQASSQVFILKGTREPQKGVPRCGWVVEEDVVQRYGGLSGDLEEEVCVGDRHKDEREEKPGGTKLKVRPESSRKEFSK